MTPQRTCIGCRAVDEQSRLIRLVRRGTLVVDGTQPRLPGRGAYLHASCLALTQRRQAVRRAFGPGAELEEATRQAIALSGSCGPDTL